MYVSKTQIDRLGDRLKVGPHSESDLRSLDEFRRSFGAAYEAVVGTIRQRGHLPTGRPAKSTVSIVEKLRRESIRLSQIQDIAGCRVVIGNIDEQDQFVGWLVAEFPAVCIIDRRHMPSHGYRAVHAVVTIVAKSIEIQVRTTLQHLWAEVSEKSSDVLDPTIKYGGGPKSWRDFLTKCSASVAAYEEFERKHYLFMAAKQEADAAHRKLKNAFDELSAHDLPDHARREMQETIEASTRALEIRNREERELQDELARLFDVNTDLLASAISRLNEWKRQNNDFPD
jgi:putative GTP pyrophosphokinase